MKDEKIRHSARAAGIMYAMSLMSTWKTVSLEDVDKVAKDACEQIDDLHGYEGLVEQSIRDAIEGACKACETYLATELGKEMSEPFVSEKNNPGQVPLS